ncbi:MAG: YdcF family protein [Richelia sp.]|nr:YdcF family protein [Richelia sp.]CDN10347.1 FIG00874789: hypothetical protein [Richelia intracellularis]
MLIFLPLSVWWTHKEIKAQLITPQAVLVLGGSTKYLEREKFTAQFARQHPNLPIWITGGSPKISTEEVFQKAGISPKRLNLDYEAVDTVSNFTTIIDDLESRGIKSVYLITSDFHMPRAKVVGDIVLGSRGIYLKSVPVPSRESPEPIQKSVRDGARALVWVATGFNISKKKTARM